MKIMKFPAIQFNSFLYFLFFNIINGESDNLTVRYYEDLIKKYQAEAHAYQLPDDAYEFKPDNDKNLREFGTFDYIIVGAGSAGAVIATRLSEQEDVTVLLIEAGGHEDDYSNIPGQMQYLQGSRLNWNHKSIPQTTCCLGMANKECQIPRGKALGGCSVINGLMYVRGNKHDYNSWAKAGNLGWSYKHVLPYFIRSENSQINGDRGYHGKGGPLNVEYHRPYSPQYYAFVEANVELGRKVVDFNGRQQLGVGPAQINTIFGKRDSTGKAFLSQAWRRNNLKVLTNSYATKVLIEEHNKVAYGVQFSHNKQMFAAMVSKEVILSAGAIGSPQLLMLSGIGPKKHLKKLNIPVIKNLPVGEYLQDHATYYGLWFTSNYTEPIKSLTKTVEDFLNGFGRMTIVGNMQGLAFLQTKLMKVPGVPDIELVILPAVTTNDFIQKAYGYTNETYSIWTKLKPENAFTIYLILLHPKSVGSLKLRSANPYDYPLIDLNFLSDSKGKDIETMYEGAQMVLEIINATAFRKYNAQLADTRLPACKSHEYLSKEFWYCQLTHLTMHLYHPIGTCKMGLAVAKDAVVDYCLKVHGIKRLRVADASVFPSTTSGHTNAPAIMAGEKLSDMLKGKLPDKWCSK